ncbi:MAG: DNA repair protein RecO [Cyanobacteria bacterium P01_F01_bin.42]
MSPTYQTEGIVLKSMAMGEADRLITLLSPDRGLIKAIASGARRPRSKLGGRTGLFVVSQIMVNQGRSLDKLLQADVKLSFPKLSQALTKLTAAQYWAELVLLQSQSEHSNQALYDHFLSQLQLLETCPSDSILMLMLQGVSQLLFFAGISPELEHCCRSQTPIEEVMFTSGQGVYFSCADGGTVMGEILIPRSRPVRNAEFNSRSIEANKTDYTEISSGGSQPRFLARESVASQRYRLSLSQWNILNAISPAMTNGEQTLQNTATLGQRNWLYVEKVLRSYTQHHFERAIQSAKLVDSVFAHPSPLEATP